MTRAATSALRQLRPAGNKYRAVRTELDGFRFDSKREAAVYAELKLREKADDICGLVVHPTFRLTVNNTLIATYTADFSWFEIGDGYIVDNLHVVDVKSPATAKRRDFVLIRKLMKALHNIDVEVWQ